MHISRHPGCPHPCTAVLVYPTGQGVLTGGEAHSLSGEDDLGKGQEFQCPGIRSTVQKEGQGLEWACPLGRGEGWGWSRVRGASEVGPLTGALLALVKGP